LDSAKAAEIETRIAEIDPYKKILLMKLGDAYKHEQRFAEAGDCYRKLMAIEPSNEAAVTKLREIDAMLRA